MYDELVKRLREDVPKALSSFDYDFVADWIKVKGSIKEAADAIEKLSKPRWIPVTERLPEPLVNVLALYGDGRMDIDWVDHEGCFVCENLYDGVTHWMPLPEPPEEVTNDA